MTGDYTKVPLRAGERWTGARMQQGRVLLDHEWNLNLDATSRDARALAGAVIGPSGVPAGSDAFDVYVQAGTPNDLLVQGGTLWVDGMAAVAPGLFRYSEQEGVPALPTGRALVYLDVFPEHLQPAEAWADLVDPALDPVDSAARTRVGWRLRVGPAPTGDCEDALAALQLRDISNGWLTIGRSGPVVAADPCAPPGDPLEVVPDGLFRVEVLDTGDVAHARFAWSADDGASAVRILQVVGATVTLPPSPSVKFAKGDLVEVSWLARRADRLDHGPLYTVADTQGTGSGQKIVLDSAVRAPAGAAGLVLRRWDGQAVGAPTPVHALLHGVDLGLFFVGTDYVGGSTDVDLRTRAYYLAGDWWGAALRAGSGVGIEQRTEAPPDGIEHRAAPLALVHLDDGDAYREHDCRAPFLPLTELSRASTCTVTAFPGDDLQKAVDRLPYDGGELCLAAGQFTLDAPVVLSGMRRVVVTGVGPATVLTTSHETALRFEKCSEVEVRMLRAEGGAGTAGEPSLNGALTFVGCTDVRVVDCDLCCPGGDTLRQTCVTVRADATHAAQPERVHIANNRCQVGEWQAGILIADADEATVTGNEVRTPLPPTPPDLWRGTLPATLRRLLDHGVPAVTPPEGPVPEPPDVVRPVPPGGGRPPHLPTAGVADLLRSVDRTAIDAAKSPQERRRAVRDAVRDLLEPGPGQPAPDGTAPGGRPPLPRDLVRVLDGLRAAYAVSGMVGIEVVGRRAYTVRITGNLVDGVVRGIHVGTSDAKAAGGGHTDRRHSSAPLISAREVVITGNVVHSRVPWQLQLQRHAIYVGNADSVHISDTTATLWTPGAPTIIPLGITRQGWDVEAIRLFGQYGSYVRVRDSNLSDFSVGVRMRPINPPDESDREHILWMVSETLARYASVPVDAPYALVQNAVIGW
ncbi:DUF6519 domain-containing protein [Yinghuangia seranimata]|uniref:DUF6519 domain-containing protein n=1 Tax=Yinghuangia seranimata TaxID=408067 RepID=UPI00248B4556|nr:DUF6519 domain-containing protein [Yinghuangia seranimata]MDI2131681.1 DUF6519 domain-containing protein [Yinghuangia seranimata]